LNDSKPLMSTTRMASLPLYPAAGAASPLPGACSFASCRSAAVAKSDTPRSSCSSLRPGGKVEGGEVEGGATAAWPGEPNRQ
jgi:hypothetical protein